MPDREHMTRIFDAWNDGSVEAMTDYWSEDGDWVWADPPDMAGGGVHRGRTEVEAHLREMMEVLGSMRIEADEATPMGADLFVAARFHVAGVKSGIKMDTVSYQLYRFDEAGRVKSCRMFGTREEAERAASDRQEWG